MKFKDFVQSLVAFLEKYPHLADIPIGHLLIGQLESCLGYYIKKGG